MKQANTQLTPAARAFMRLAAMGAVVAFLVMATPAALAVSEGCLQALDKDKNPIGFCPLKHTDVNVDVAGFVARVTLVQEFGNPYDKPIEAVYTFPMSDRAAVDTMTMTIGERVVKGIIKPREEARRIYEQARNAGKTASLLDQERPNIFTQSVANILPGNPIRITISYVEYLKYEDGQYEFSFPMVVGPRYIPGAPTQPAGTDQVPDAGRITPPVTPEGTRAGHDVSLSVRLDAGLPIQDVRSELHEVDVERPSENQATVKLKNQSEIPNRDFILKYRVGGRTVGDAVLSHAGPKGGFFTLILQPPDRVAPEEATPKEMMFVIDCSGSMQGFPIEKAKNTMRLCIEQMNPNDTFDLVSFSGGLGQCFPRPMPNTPANRQTALDYLANLSGSGGTEMMPAIRSALEGQDDGHRLRVVCFMTDGFIGNDMEIIAAVQKNVKTARVFAFGIGNGVNRFLIEGMARAGRGSSEVVTLESDADAGAKRFHERIQSPVLTDISVDFGHLPIEDVYPDPEAIPDLFSAQPVVLKGRYTGTGEGKITVRGMTAAGPFERKIPVFLPEQASEHDVLAPLWARARIDWLMEQDYLGIQQGRPNATLKNAITKLGLDFNLVTQFTSFVAVEEKVVNADGKPQTVQVPVEMTDGVSYEGVFGPQNGPVRGAAAQMNALGYMAKSAPAASGTGQMAHWGTLLSPGNGSAAPQSMAESRAERSASRESITLDRALPSPAPAPATPDPAPVKAKDSAKLDPSLWDLASKLVNGKYEQGNVKVKDGYVEVVIRMKDDSPEHIEALKQLGAKILSHSASGKKVYARVKVTDLDTLAGEDFVTRIEPPTSN